ncbi:DUF4179 domain-containing protein [Clostridium cylindrosporum]|uniref:DUF4179 domain-containing protein n=1 Tax=Clostridium cylindrosporum DSM 605 TaxID=1121307 RepID=A0A0J8DBX9_CLOCY|nr:DUF4179 domain-containing protein [Clostridium cylindrosporum]KMT21809.1 hypothetical protein CLCY_3c00760 [Clostridium cylindrosporum DSM 605]
MKDKREYSDNYIYDILDNLDLNEIPVEKESEAQECNINSIKSNVLEKIKPEVKSESNIVKRAKLKWSRYVVAASIFLVAILGVFIGGEVSKARISHKDNSTWEYGMDIDRDALRKYSTSLNKVVTDKGININIKNILVDGTAIWINYEVSSDKFNFSHDKWQSEGFEFPELEVKVNGVSIGPGGLGADLIDKHTLNIMQELEVKNIEVNGELSVDFSTKEVMGVKGNWSTSFKVDAKDILAETKEYKVGKIFYIDKSIVMIKSLAISPIQTTIYYNAIGIRNERVDLIVKNENGLELTPLGSGYSGKFFRGSGEVKFSSGHIKGDTLILTPQIHILTKNGMETKLNERKVIKVNISK